MNDERKVVVYQTKCRLCGQKIQGISEEQCQERLVDHIDNKCKAASTMRDWEEQGVYKEAMQILRLEDLEKGLKKLLRHYSIEEIEEALEMLKEEK